MSILMQGIGLECDKNHSTRSFSDAFPRYLTPIPTQL